LEGKQLKAKFSNWSFTKKGTRKIVVPEKSAKTARSKKRTFSFKGSKY
jgi:hypothetical protein